MMNIFKDTEPEYVLQATWNQLDQAQVIMYDQYELAEITDIDASEWSKFLRNGKVQKYIDTEVELFKQAQMRKLIGRATTNDKSVGTAQMLNAIGKTLEDEQQETNFFIYSYVPLTPNECAAPNVTQDTRWTPPENIHEEIEQIKTEDKVEVKPIDIKTKLTETEVSDDEFF